MAFFSLKRVTIKKSVGEKINTYILTFMGCYCVLSTILNAVDGHLIMPSSTLQDGYNDYVHFIDLETEAQGSPKSMRL